MPLHYEHSTKVMLSGMILFLRSTSTNDSYLCHWCLFSKKKEIWFFPNRNQLPSPILSALLAVLNCMQNVIALHVNVRALSDIQVHPADLSFSMFALHYVMPCDIMKKLCTRCPISFLVVLYMFVMLQFVKIYPLIWIVINCEWMTYCDCSNWNPFDAYWISRRAHIKCSPVTIWQSYCRSINKHDINQPAVLIREVPNNNDNHFPQSMVSQIYIPPSKQLWERLLLLFAIWPTCFRDNAALLGCK